jgi:hypothetical protein
MELARAAMQRGLAAGIQEAITTTVRTDSPAPAAAADLSAPPASVTQLDQLFVTMKKLFSSGEFAVKWLRKKFNVVQPCELDEKQAEEALMLLTRELADKQLAAANANAPVVDPTNGNTDAQPATENQRENIKGLTIHLYKNSAPLMQVEWLASLGLAPGEAAKLTFPQAQQRLNFLNEQPGASGYIPF